MEKYIANAEGRIPVPGHTAMYPPGYRISILHGAFAGMEPPEQDVESSVPQVEQPVPAEPAQAEGAEPSQQEEA